MAIMITNIALAVCLRRTTNSRKIPNENSIVDNKTDADSVNQWFVKR